MQQVFKEQCAVVSDLKAKKRQAFIDQNITAQTNLREEAERNSPKIFESEIAKKMREEIEEFINQTVNQFKNLRHENSIVHSTRFQEVKDFFSNKPIHNIYNFSDNFSNFASYQGLNFLIFYTALFSKMNYFTT